VTSDSSCARRGASGALLARPAMKSSAATRRRATVSREGEVRLAVSGRGIAWRASSCVNGPNGASGLANTRRGVALVPPGTMRGYPDQRSGEAGSIVQEWTTANAMR
jgi:hypothetical protein